MKYTLYMLALSALLGTTHAATGQLDTDATETLLTSATEVFGADGLGITTVHSETLLHNDAGVAQNSQMPIYFNSDLEKIQLLDCYTLKPDGRKFPLDRDAVYTQLDQSAGDDGTPEFDSSKKQVLVYPQVAAGDTLVLNYRRIEIKPVIPGQISMQLSFTPDYANDDYETTIMIPDKFKMTLVTQGINVARGHSGGTQSFHISYHHPLAQNDVVSEIDERETSPTVTLSSYHGWDQFAAVYARQIAATEQPSATIIATANQITAGVADRATQTRLIYNWVSTRIRYVAVELGAGGFVPHDAAKILLLGYGDCKDHATLFGALLAAKGIPSERVLIDADDLYHIGDVPYMSAFDHMITWLPELGIYADTTAQMAPLGTLPFDEYGKQVVHVEANGQAERRIPLLAKGAAYTLGVFNSSVDTHNRVTTDIAYFGTGPFDFNTRYDGFYAQSQGEGYADSVLQDRNLTGHASVSSSSQPTDLTTDFTLRGHSLADPEADILADNWTTMPAGLNMGYVPGDMLLGPLWPKKLPADAPVPCYSGTEERRYSLQLPDGYRFDHAPEDLNYHTAHATYSSVWTINADATSIEQRVIFTSHVDQAICSGAVRQEAVDLLAKINKISISILR